MKKYSKICVNALFAFVVFSLFLASVAFAANGDGVVLSYKPNVVSTNEKVVLDLEFRNDGDKCIDEILVMPPDTWGGLAKATYSRSTPAISNEESNDNVTLVADSQSIRFDLRNQPANMLCPGETTDITIEGLTAPSNYEVSEIVIKTSDQQNSGNQPSEVYQTIDTPIPGTNPPFALPKVYVTTGTKLEIEYFHITGFTTSGFSGRAWGAWARLNTLVVNATAADPSVQIVMETGTTDNVIYSGPIAAGVNTLTMNYAGWVQPLDSTVFNGYLQDQAGARAFYINGYAGSLTLLGSTDAIMDDADYTTSGLTTAKGTIITAGGSEQRKILVNLVDDNGYDVINEQIPLEAETDLGTIVEVAPFFTDANGDKYFTLNAGCDYGVANVKISTDPLKTTPDVTEFVGIDSNVPASFDVVEGDEAEVGAGESQLIKVEVYDYCGNLVSNTHQQLVGFDYITETCGTKSKLSQVPGDVSNNHEQEMTDMGDAEVYLNTDCQLCTHEVQVTASGLGSEIIQLYGVNGPPSKMKVTTDKHTIDADECVVATVEVTDKCGNLVSEIPSEVGDEMEQWESIVRVTIDEPLNVNQPGWTGTVTTEPTAHDNTYVADSDFREESIYQPWVQGKLTRGTGTVTICGCQGLGQYDIVATSDTIEEGRETVNVINAPADCVEVTTIDQLLQCQTEAKIDVKVKDICGNFLINQGQCNGNAEYCINLVKSGTCLPEDSELSTSTVCVDVGVGGSGMIQVPVDLLRKTDDCCALDITAVKGTGCCADLGTLPQCGPVEVLFHGAPSYMTTEFFKTRKLCSPFGCPIGTDKCSEKDEQGQHLYCWEQLHEAFDMESASETVSEEVLDLFTVYDACDHVVKDYTGTLDVEVRGEDVPSIYQVDHPYELTGGGLCQGHVDCSALTQFGQAKCEETLTDAGDSGHCDWVTAPKVGDCQGTPDCTVIQFAGQCANWGCQWDGTTTDGTPKCHGDPDYECEDPTAPVYANPIADWDNVCGEVGCTWNPSHECEGSATQFSCAPYTKEQCQMVGASQDPKNDNNCEWINDCNAQFEEKIIKKLVIHNTKPETVKQWLPLEKDDIMVDKLAFQMTFEPDPSLWLYVYLESETTPGFQSGEDMLVGKAPALFGNQPTIIELIDSKTPHWDDQRQGGVLIRAGDSRDFYIMLVNQDPNGPLTIPCGTYGLEFLWYQDYNSPDVTNYGAGNPDDNKDGIVDCDDPMNGAVEDGCIDSDNFQWLEPGLQAPHPVCPFGGPGLQFRTDSRNDDYGHSTPDYGFGDRFIYSLGFSNGTAWMKFRDLVAEDVKVFVTNIAESGEQCKYTNDISATPNPEEITFVEQPATQIKLINHDAGDEKNVSCYDEWDPATSAYHMNIQVTDGFDNPHAKEGIEIRLESCLKMPFGGPSVVSTNGIGQGMYFTMWQYCHDDANKEKPVCDYIHGKDSEYCFTREDLRDIIKYSKFGNYFGDVLFGDFFGAEFSQWIDSYFENAEATFYTSPSALSPTTTVTTDAQGRAEIYVLAKTAGLYRIKAIPTALDAASTYVEFDADRAAKLDIVALPSFGIPADGEEEAMLLLRALDVCDNVVYEPVSGVTVTATGKQVVVSQDFECKNNYDKDATGILEADNPFGLTCLAVLDDIPEVATITASGSNLEADSTTVAFQGAPVKLAITSITPSDRLPADGKTGGWVTVEVQDINGNRVTGYLGDGFSGDPGDPFGYTDYVFENICVKVSNDGEIEDSCMDGGVKFGWVGLDEVGKCNVYCGDLVFGRGRFYVTLDKNSCNHGGTVDLTVYDNGWNGQEYNENGLPYSKQPTQLTPAHGSLDFVDPTTMWNIWADKPIALADGKSTVTLTVQLENPYMDVRQAVDGTVYVGGTADAGAVISWEGDIDELNPTSMAIVTDPVTGRATLKLTSTKPGKAEITITGGRSYVCHHKDFEGYVCPDCVKVYELHRCKLDKHVPLTPKTIEVEFIGVANKQLYLDTGWNFISVPFELNASKNQMNELFNMSNVVSAYGFNAGTQTWVALGGASQLMPLEGYWIKVANPEVTTLVYATPAFPSIPTKSVQAGWNAVGLTWDSPTTMKNALISIKSVYAQVIGWVASLQKYGFPIANTDGTGPFENGGVNMEPKQGYWIWVTAPSTLAGLSAK